MTALVKTLPLSDLNQLNLMSALDRHQDLAGHPPTTLIVSAHADAIDRAYRLCGSSEFPGNPKLLIAPVPGLPAGVWGVLSPDAVLLSNDL